MTIYGRLALSLSLLFGQVSSYISSNQPCNNDICFSRRQLLFQRLPAVATATSLIASTSVLSEAQAVNVLPSQKTGVIWHAAKGQALPALPSTLQRLINLEWFGGNSIKNSGIVCISERHDDFEHHLVQLRCIQGLQKALSTSGSVITVGMECFQRNHQIYLDKFIHNPDYDLNRLKADTKWDYTWGYDFLLYAPLLMFAKTKKLELYGLHPTQEQVQHVLDRGIEAVPTSLRQGVESTSEPEHRHYQQYQRIMGVSTHALEQKPSLRAHFDRWYQVQRFREEFMAESVAQMVQRHQHSQSGHWTAVLAGENHILGREGIPSRALRRSSNGLMDHSVNRGVYTIMPRTVTFPVVANDAPTRMQADYVWFVENDYLKPSQVNPSPFRTTMTA